jgi:UDPglucose 6-dehydrogenase
VKKIAVIGSGYVGTTTAAILANCGYSVVALDINKQKVEKIRAGRAPFFEHGLDKLIEHVVENGKLVATSSYTDLSGADIIFSCVGTPDNPDGSSNLDYVFAAAKEAIKHMSDAVIFVQKSTVPVGTGARIEEIFAKSGKSVRYVSNPEFLREGTAIADTLWFDRIVAGGADKEAVESVLDLYQSVEKCRDKIAAVAGVSTQSAPNGSFITTNRNSAELIKVTANAFLALKISFSNSIAKLADQTGADINEVMDAVGADRRIGRAFLNAGRGYGGGCFPKDVTGLISSATEHGVELPIMIAAADVNETMPGYIANKAKDALGELKGKKIAVLGLAFKAGTSDSRRSPGVKLANILSHDGAEVSVYDPEASDEAKEDLRKAVKLCTSAEEAVRSTDAVFIATDWPELLNLDLPKLKRSMRGALFVDCMNVFDTSAIQQVGLQYIGVGR